MAPKVPEDRQVAALESRRLSSGARFLAAGAIVVLGTVFAPVANAQLSFQATQDANWAELADEVAFAQPAPVQSGAEEGTDYSPLLNNFCLIQGPNGGECGSSLVFTATSPVQPTTPFNATWSLLNNTAGASFVGPSACAAVTTCSATVTTSQTGSYVIRVTLAFSGGVLKTCQKAVTVTDNTPPVITCPPDVTVNCGTPIDPSVTGNPVVTDCSPFTVMFSDQVTGQNCAGAIITRTWTAIDSNSLVSTCTQTITPQSSVAITCPGPVSVQCFSQVPAPNVGSVIATDLCGGPVTVTHVGDSASAGMSSCNNVITRTYQAVNLCGNQATCTQTITVNDTTAPSITCPGPVGVQCFSQVPGPNIQLVITSDNCGGVVNVTHLGDSASAGTSNCNNVITRTYQAVDTCGNTNTCTQTITVNDTTAPSITCPGPVNVQCFSQVPAPSTTAVIASDNCGGVVNVTHLGDSASAGTSNCNNVITRTYQAVDTCGNTNTCTQILTVNDTTAPTIVCPGPINLQCFSQVPAPSTAGVATFDNCGEVVNVIHVGDSASAGTSNCNNVITRTYQGTDTCGNTNTCTQTITVNDTTAPIIICPGPVTVECFSQVPAPSTTAVSSSDNCGGVVNVIHLGDSATGGTSSCNNVITRTYLATDACGNTNTCTQTITANDTTPPVIMCPVDFTAPCGTPTDPGTTGTATATDNCNPAPIVTFSDVLSGGPCPAVSETITRTWTANDGCNQVTCVQIITLTPPPPVFPECVVDIGGGCGSPTPVLTGSLSGNTFTFTITGGPPNGQGVLAAQLAPFGPNTPLPGTPCVIQLATTSPPTVLLGSIQLDGTGFWTQSFVVPMVPFPLDVRVQAAFFPQPRFTNGIEIMRPCPPCTYTLAKWATNTGPTSVNYDTNWLTVFPAGMDIGIFNPGNGNAPPNGFRWLATVQGRNALKTFLNSGDGTNAPIAQDATNPINTFGSGTIARMTAVLQLNIAFSAAGFLGVTNPSFGSMIYDNPGDSLDGFTVAQILAVSNQILAGTAGLPLGYTFTSFTDLLESLAGAFDNCVPSIWAGQHLDFPTT